MQTKLPSRLYNARTHRVIHPSCIEVELSLNFGITVSKNVMLEGGDTRKLDPEQHKKANHCLVLIVGGRNLLLHTDDSLIDGHLHARVYLDAQGATLPFGMYPPYGLSEDYPEVGALYAWAVGIGYDADEVRSLMRNVPK